MIQVNKTSNTCEGKVVRQKEIQYQVRKLKQHYLINQPKKIHEEQSRVVASPITNIIKCLKIHKTHTYSLTLQHVSVRIVCNGKDVWRHFSPSLSFVHANNLFSVDGETVVRVDSHTEQPRIGLRGREREREKEIDKETQIIGKKSKLKKTITVKHLAKGTLLTLVLTYYQLVAQWT